MHHLQVDSRSMIALFQDISEGQWKGKSPQWEEIQAVYLLVHFPEG